eukprot:scaffold15822_cov108-Isochrysis_galbana.AAC.6
MREVYGSLLGCGACVRLFAACACAALWMWIRCVVGWGLKVGEDRGRESEPELITYSLNFNSTPTRPSDCDCNSGIIKKIGREGGWDWDWGVPAALTPPHRRRSGHTRQRSSQQGACEPPWKACARILTTHDSRQIRAAAWRTWPWRVNRRIVPSAAASAS